MRNGRLISKFMTSQKQTIAINIWTMKHGQVISYNMRNIFLENSYTKCVGETIPRAFSKKLKLRIFLDQLSKVLYSLSLLYVKLSTFEIYEN